MHSSGTKNDEAATSISTKTKMPTSDETPAYRRLVKQILEQISDKSGYFIEERLKILLEPYTKNDKTLVRLDNVFAVSQFSSMYNVYAYLTK